jgi:hypothetical protein
MSIPTSIPNNGSATVTETVSNSVNDAVDTAKQAAGQLGSHFRQQIATRADEQVEIAAAGLTGLADAMRRMGDVLKTQDQSPITQFAAQYGDSIARQVERGATYLRERDAGRIVSDVEDMARRRPGAFLAGAFVLGVLGSRFLKSSRPVPNYTRTPDPSRALPPATYPAGTSPSWPAVGSSSNYGSASSAPTLQTNTPEPSGSGSWQSSSSVPIPGEPGSLWYSTRQKASAGTQGDDSF